MVVPTNIEKIKSLELEDYIAIKRYAYDFFVKHFPEGQDIKFLTQYIENVMDYQINDKEAIIFKATALLPFDREVCEVYQYGDEMYKKMKHINYIYGFSFGIKKFEIEHFNLDKLIEEGVLVPPTHSDYSQQVEDNKSSRI